MHYFKREVVQSLFYETLDDFVVSSFSRYRPTPNYLPIAGRDELEVDWGFSILNRHIYLYGVKDGPKARLAALACREFQIARLPFRSVIVHEDFENSLTKKDKARITSAADKQFTSLSDFQSNGEEYFARELVSSPNVN